MPLAIWPISLQQAFEADGASFRPNSGSVPFNTESGEPITRPRFTGDIADAGGTIPCTDDQAIDALTFWKIDLERGSLPFIWIHPITGAEVEYFFVSEPVFNAWPGFGWKVSIMLKKRPDNA